MQAKAKYSIYASDENTIYSNSTFEDALLGVNKLSPEPSSIVVRGESPHSTPKLGVPEYAP